LSDVKLGGNNLQHVEYFGGAIIDMLNYQPDAATWHSDYYYDTRVNKLYKRMVLINRPLTGVLVAKWKPISEYS
jgi:hypothetical protein